jgi:hypothetical protein
MSYNNSNAIRPVVWWTKEQVQQAAKQYYTMAAAASIINERVPGQYNYISQMCFRQEVLDKYRNNEFCDIDSEHSNISFLLDSNTKSAASTVNYVVVDMYNHVKSK